MLIHALLESCAAPASKIAIDSTTGFHGEKTTPCEEPSTPRPLLRGLLRFVAAASLAVAAVQDSSAQSAQITGRVTDPTGAVVSRAEIRVSHVGTTLEKTSATNDAGIYVL